MKEKILKYIEDWEKKCYFNGIPDEAPTRLEQLNKVPSYRLICKAILKNDFALETLGFTKNKPLVYHELKKAELIKRGVYERIRSNDQQIRINF